MDLLPMEGTGDNLHRAVRVIAQCGDPDACHASVAGGKECRVPAEQAVRGEGRIAVPRGVQYHLDHAVDVRRWK